MRRVASLRDASRRAAVAETRAAQLAGSLSRAEDTIAEMRLELNELRARLAAEVGERVCVSLQRVSVCMYLCLSGVRVAL